MQSDFTKLFWEKNEMHPQGRLRMIIAKDSKTPAAPS
jgi:hypothetical protein